VREEGGDLALAIRLRAAVREARERAGGAHERAPRVEILALAPVPCVGPDAVEERLGDDARHGRATAAAAPQPQARAGGSEEC
jgi:hypothetical protein